MDRARPPVAPPPRPAQPDERNELGPFTARTLVVIGLVVLALLLWQIAHVLLLAFGGIVLAVVFRAFAAPLARWTGLSKSRATGIVIVVIALLVGGATWYFGRQAAGQFNELAQSLQQAYAQVRETLEQSGTGSTVLGRVRSGLEGALQPLASSALGLVSGLAQALVVLAAAVFLAIAPESYRAGLSALIPPARRALVNGAIDAAGRALSQWLLGQGISMLGVGIATGIGLWWVGVPMPFALAVIAALLDFVPFFGPVIAAIPAVLLGFQVSPQTAMYAALVYLVVQQIEGNLLQPLAQRWAVHLPPALGALAVVAFGVLFGIVGVLFAVPLAVVTMVLVQKLYTEPLQRNHDQDVAVRAP